MEWNVYYHDFNHQKITTYNVFNHGSFNQEINQLSQKNLNKSEFTEQLRIITMYYFWSKTEWEVIVSPWVGKGDDEKIDVYDQLKLNWNKFVDYVWNEVRGGNK